MHVIAETVADGVRERQVTVGHVPGLVWTLASGDAPWPALILIAHGGGQHKRAPGVAARAARFVREGFVVAALDAPAHGDRPKTERDESVIAEIRALQAAGQPVLDLITAYNSGIAAQAVPEWQALITALAEAGLTSADGPAGFVGLSAGAATGLPLLAAEPRITAAVIGLVGLVSDELGAAAARVTTPVEFLLQWDDELVPREAGLALFDALGSPDKTLHANPGKHADVPRHEVASSVLFFRRHLLAGP
jgi:dienelactone hydrolase